MKLRRIAENYRSFSRCKLDDWLVSEILQAIFNNIVSLEFRSDTAELLDRDRLAVYSMVDLPHDVSSACVLHVLTVDDKLVGMAWRQNKREWQGAALDTEQFAKVAGDIAAAVLRADISNLADVDLDQNIDFRGYPMHFLDAGETMFTLQNPRNVYRLNEVRERHPAHVVDSIGQPHSVEHIGEFQQKGWTNGKAPSDDLISVIVDGVERIVDATQLVFELIPGQGNLTEAVKAFQQPASWKVVQASAPDNALKVNNARISITEPNRWDSREKWVGFLTHSAMARFLEKYPFREVFPGPFDESVLEPFGGKIVRA